MKWNISWCKNILLFNVQMCMFVEANIMGYKATIVDHRRINRNGMPFKQSIRRRSVKFICSLSLYLSFPNALYNVKIVFFIRINLVIVFNPILWVLYSSPVRVAVFVIRCSFKMINAIDMASEMGTFTNNRNSHWNGNGVKENEMEKPNTWIRRTRIQPANGRPTWSSASSSQWKTH